MRNSKGENSNLTLLVTNTIKYVVDGRITQYRYLAQNRISGRRCGAWMESTNVVRYGVLGMNNREEYNMY